MILTLGIPHPGNTNPRVFIHGRRLSGGGLPCVLLPTTGGGRRTAPQSTINIAPSLRQSAVRLYVYNPIKSPIHNQINNQISNQTNHQMNNQKLINNPIKSPNKNPNKIPNKNKNACRQKYPPLCYVLQGAISSLAILKPETPVNRCFFFL